MNDLRPGKTLTILIALIVLHGFAASPAFAAAEDVLGCVHETLRANTAWTADFNQSQHLAVLSAPLQSRGRVEVSEGTIRWEMVAPIADVLTIDRDGRIHSDNGEPVNHPAIANTIRLLLTLDVTGLKRTFGVTGTCADGTWSLQLKPLEGVLAKVFSGIEISGKATVDTVVLRSLNTDFTEIRFAAPANLPGD